MTELDNEARRILNLARQAYLQGDYMYALNVVGDDLVPYYVENKQDLTNEQLSGYIEKFTEAYDNNDYESLLSVAAEANEFYVQQGW